MCAAFEVHGRAAKPGMKVHAASRDGAIAAAWAGFARSEILGWWIRRGAQEIDLRAERFAERSDRTRKLTWAPVPDSQVIAALFEPESGVIKVVTRAATPEEEAFFEHPRMPLLVPRRFGEIEIPQEPLLL